MNSIYSVVIFIDDDSVATVPSSWLLNKNECKWPNYRDGAKLSRAVAKCIKPDPTWQCFKIRMLHSYSKFR